MFETGKNIQMNINFKQSHQKCQINNNYSQKSTRPRIKLII